MSRPIYVFQCTYKAEIMTPQKWKSRPFKTRFVIALSSLQQDIVPPASTVFYEVSDVKWFFLNTLVPEIPELLENMALLKKYVQFSFKPLRLAHRCDKEDQEKPRSTFSYCPVLPKSVPAGILAQLNSLPRPGTYILGKPCAKDKARLKTVKKNKLKRLFGVLLMQHFLRQNFWRKDHHKGPKPKPCDGRLTGCKEFGKLGFDCIYMLMTTYWYKVLDE